VEASVRIGFSVYQVVSVLLAMVAMTGDRHSAHARCPIDR
jgi:hypothetical protein